MSISRCASQICFCYIQRLQFSIIHSFFRTGKKINSKVVGIGDVCVCVCDFVLNIPTSLFNIFYKNVNWS
jgi:hypothetical protein